MKINLVMIVKNEERCLSRCLKAAKPLVDEIVVAVDASSTDRTKDIAKAAGAKIYEFTWVRDFSTARNFSLEHSDADWNLVLDADEYLHPVKRKQVEEIIRKMDRLYGAGKWMGAILRHDLYYDCRPGTKGTAAANGQTPTISSCSALLPRLLPRGVRYRGTIHEQPDTSFPGILIPLETDHDGYLQEGKEERNLSYLKEAVQNEPENSYYWYQMAVTLRGLNCLEESLEWFRRLWRKGRPDTGYWADGILRYLYTLTDLQTAHTLEEAGEVIEAARPSLGCRADFCFVCGIFYMKLVLSDVRRYLAFLPKIEESYLEALRLGEHPELGMVEGTGSYKAAYNLGVWYELSGQPGKARRYYQMSAAKGYQAAKERLKGQ